MGRSGHYRCFACGCFADEVTGGPTAEEKHQAYRWEVGVLEVDDRVAVACWPCFWATDPDLWIDADTWDALNPLVPSSRLPLALPFREDGKHEDPASYPWPPGETSR